jgi:hypothetical protein
MGHITGHTCKLARAQLAHTGTGLGAARSQCSRYKRTQPRPGSRCQVGGEAQACGDCHQAQLTLDPSALLALGSFSPASSYCLYVLGLKTSGLPTSYCLYQTLRAQRHVHISAHVIHQRYQQPSWKGKEGTADITQRTRRRRRRTTPGWLSNCRRGMAHGYT